MTNMKTKTTTSKSTKTTSTPRKGRGASPTKVRPSQAYMFHQAIAAINAAREQLPLATVTMTRDRAELVDLRRSARVPDAFLEAMASLVSQNGGSLMGLSFDVDAARELLAYGTAAKPFIDMARDVAHQVDEDIVRKRAALADHAMSILRALEALAETPEGKGVARDAQLLRSTLGIKKRKQRTPKQAAAAPEAPATVTAPAVVISPVKPALSNPSCQRRSPQAQAAGRDVGVGPGGAEGVATNSTARRAPTISHRPDRPRRWYPGGGVLCAGDRALAASLLTGWVARRASGRARDGAGGLPRVPGGPQRPGESEGERGIAPQMHRSKAATSLVQASRDLQKSIPSRRSCSLNAYNSAAGALPEDAARVRQARQMHACSARAWSGDRE